MHHKEEKDPPPFKNYSLLLKYIYESKVIEQNKPATTVDKTEKPAKTFKLN